MPVLAVIYLSIYFILTFLTTVVSFPARISTSVWLLETVLHLAIGVLAITYWKEGLLFFFHREAKVALVVVAVLWEPIVTRMEARHSRKRGTRPEKHSFLRDPILMLCVFPVYVLATVAAFSR